MLWISCVMHVSHVALRVAKVSVQLVKSVTSLIHVHMICYKIRVVDAQELTNTHILKVQICNEFKFSKFF